MFDVENAVTFTDEIKGSILTRDKFLEVGLDTNADYHGPHYNADAYIPEAPAPENIPFEYISWSQSKVVYHNPQIDVETKSAGVNKEITLRMQHRLNGWATEVKLWKHLRRVYTDMCIFGHGVMHTRLDYMPNSGGSGGAENMDHRLVRPSCGRLNPWEFILDNRTDDIQKARFMGHLWRRDMNDLKKNPYVNQDVLNTMTMDTGYIHMEPRWLNRGRRPTRKEIFGYSIWVSEITLPGYENNPFYNGTIYTMGMVLNPDGSSTAPRWLMDPKPFFGRPQGPYQMFGVYDVPGQIYPLSALVATRESMESLNAHVAAIDDGAAAYKRFIGYDPGEPKLGDALNQAMHGSTAPIPGLSTGSTVNLETGGVDPKQYEYVDIVDARVRRLLGFNQGATGGSAPSGNTATEYADIAEQRDSRLAEPRQMFAYHTSETVGASGWLFYHSRFVRSPLGHAAVDDLNPRPPKLPAENKAWDVFYEQKANGEETDIETVRESLKWPPAGEEPYFPSEKPGEEYKSMFEIWNIPWDQMQIKIDVMSMPRTDQALLQRRVQDHTKITGELSEKMKTDYWIKWDVLMKKMGESLGTTAGEEVLDLEALKEAQELEKLRVQMELQQLQMAMAQPQPSAPGAPAPGGGVPVQQGLGTQPGGMQEAQMAGANLGAAFSPV